MYMGDCCTTCFGPKVTSGNTYIKITKNSSHFVLKGNWEVYRYHFVESE
jgi:hypothetical protein